MKHYEEIIKELNSIKLYKCDSIRVGDTLYYVLQGISDQYSIKSCLISLIVILETWLTTKLYFEKSGDGSTAFLFSTGYNGRESYKKDFRGVCNLINNKTVIMPRKRRKLKAPHLEDIVLLVKWYRQIGDVIPKLTQRLRVIYSLFDAYEDYQTFNCFVKQKNVECSRLVTFFDVSCIDSFFTQKFNSIGKLTVTLQHGIFSSVANAWALKGSYSKYMLAISKFTIDEGRIAGYQNTMLPVGPMSFINAHITNKAVATNVKTIGLFLDGEIMRKDNIKAIKLLKYYCNKYQKNLIIKFHPTSDVKCYQRILKSESNITCYGTEISSIDFCDLIDIAIVRCSTTLIEALYRGVPSFIMFDENQTFNTYGNVKILKFNNIAQLSNFLDEKNLASFLRTGQDYFCVGSNVHDNYKAVFAKLGIY